MKLLFLLVLICEASNPTSKFEKILGQLSFGVNCKWDYPSQSSTHPVFLSKEKDSEEFTIVRPHIQDGKPLLKLKFKEVLLIVCPTNNEDEVESKQGQCTWNRLLSNEEINSLNDYKCNEQNNFQKKELETTCAVPTSSLDARSKLIKTYGIGFKFAYGSKVKRIDIVKYCFDPDNNMNYYTTHKIYGGLRFDENTNPTIFDDPMMEAFHHDRRSQKTEFVEKYSMDLTMKVFGLKYTTDFLILVRLIPPEDIIFEAQKKICDNPDTLILMWKSLYINQWVKVEQLVREVASKLDDQITVTTGTYEAIKVNKNGVPFLLGKRPVNTLVWKEMEWKGFCVFFLLQIELVKTFSFSCQDVCKKNGWFVPEGVDCCFFDQLIAVFPNIVLPSRERCEPLDYPTEELPSASGDKPEL